MIFRRFGLHAFSPRIQFNLTRAEENGHTVDMPDNHEGIVTMPSGKQFLVHDETFPREDQPHAKGNEGISVISPIDSTGIPSVVDKESTSRVGPKGRVEVDGVIFSRTKR